MQKVIKTVNHVFKVMKEKKIYGNLIPIYDYFQEDNYLYIVMKYCRKGDLADYIEKYKRLTEI